MTADSVTVYRSTERNAEQDATAVKNLLIQSGLNPELCDDNTPGIEDGTFEVRVPVQEWQQAEALVGTLDHDISGDPDPSPELDMVTIAELQGVTGEMEALAIQSILDANGINAVLAGSSTLPNFSFQVLIAKDDVAQAEAVLAEARAAGPAAAAEAERESEEI